MALPDFRINSYAAPIQGGLSEDFGQAIDERIAQFDANQEFADVLGYQSDILLQQVAPFENDVNYARQVMNDTRKNIEQWAQQGDYENMGREIKRGARQFSQQIAPLLENQKRYSSYLTEMEERYKKGEIGFDTYQKAKAASLANYRGIDPNNPQQSLFSGFSPSKDINVTEKVDKYIQGWKENGGSKLIMGNDGSYREITWENASENEIMAAAQEGLLADSEFTGYAQTQGAIGNEQRVMSEFNNAIAAAVKKYGFYKEKGNLEWMPQYAFENKKALELAQSLPMNPSSWTTNPGAVDIFEAQGLDIDKATGKVVLSNAYESRDGKFFKFTDPQGNQITKDEYYKAGGLPKGGQQGIASNPEFGGRLAEQGYKKIEVSSDEAVSLSNEANKQLVDMAANRYLRESIKNGNLSVNGYLGDSNLTKAFLEKNKDKYANPKYLNETAAQYKEALKNSAVITSNKRWDISVIPGAATPEFTTLKDDDILSNLTGQSVGILDTDIGGFRKGQRADLNSMLDKLQEEDGFVVKSVRRLGPLQYNPYSNQPAMSYAITLEDGDGKKKTMEVAASMQDQELQPVQDIYNIAYKGLSGNVGFHAPNTPYGRLSGQFRLRTATDIKDGKRVFTGFVEVLGPDGQKINDDRIPQNIPIEQFGDVYQKVFAPNVLAKYLNPKYRPNP